MTFAEVIAYLQANPMLTATPTNYDLDCPRRYLVMTTDSDENTHLSYITNDGY